MIELKGQVHDRSVAFFKEPRAPKAPRRGLPPVSIKRKEGNKLYEASVREWWKIRLTTDGGRCQFPGCKRKSRNRPHHSKGRGALLSASEFFLALCDTCHRHVHDNPAESYKNGMMLKRI